MACAATETRWSIDNLDTETRNIILSKGDNQTAWIRRLIKAFVVHINLKFTMTRPMCLQSCSHELKSPISPWFIF